MMYDSTIKVKAAGILALALLFLATGCQQQDTSAEWKPLWEGYLEAFNTGNLEILDGIVDPQFIRYDGAKIEANGLDSLKMVITSLRESYPDFQGTDDEVIYAGDIAIGRWHYTGTHSGAGNPALKGKRVHNTGMCIMRKKGGKLIEDRYEADFHNVLQQLGYTITPPGDGK